ncbi:hypothetical protein NY99_12920 [Xanthomonas phaseoli pv. phaseoli]|uniref:Uncharacterized protein n=1 Tax=Xanthomonas campestris pv. glycines TaxID=473421 RepID=A0AAX0I582_XANCG|nr:hypothetical protein NY99_12920 [Xanthomonas phaseoli pv. phaseoli]KHF47342.1 hypothetical protein QQ30_16845 [Xanthomonas phaseoli pv. phaseoli]KHS23090.1 hypothetical protein RM60_20355 [Xanthomonas phaseoli pv. phaseoli]OEY98796.1 hypothetical protein BIY41_06975 [Xanthomonas citri pv. glycines]OOX01659.1 hypothetical protein Xgly_17345 [Xanthomonas citri pv. glycines]
MRAVAFFSVRDCHSQRAEGARLVTDCRVAPISYVSQKRTHQLGILQRLCSCKENEFCYPCASLGFFATLRFLGLHGLALLR